GGTDTFTIADGAMASGTIDGGAGSDTINYSGDSDVTLSNSAMVRSGVGSLALASIESASLTGGISSNSFDISGWTHMASLAGGGGADTVVSAKNTNFTLTNAALSYSNGDGAITLSAMGAAVLTNSGAGGHVFNVSGWTGNGALNGSPTGSDTVTRTGDVNVILLDDELAIPGSSTLELASIDVANLTGGAGNNSFDVSA